MPSLCVLIKPASGMCNMRCDYCFYCDEANNRSQSSYGFMSDETLKNVIRRTLLRAEHSITYLFQGGEPTLRGIDFFQKVIAYQKQYNKNQIRIYNSLQTNGYAITEEWASFFKENQFLLGISVDGTKEVHDHFRHTHAGGSTYDRIEKSIQILDQYGVDYNILTVVTPFVVQNIKLIYEDYKKRGWHYQQYIACLDPLNAPKGSTPYSLKPVLYGQFLIKLFQMWYEDLLKGTHPYIRQFENYVALAKGYMAESCDQRGICGIQTVVEADGSVYPCDFYVLDEYRLGNFNKDQLDVINQRRKELGFIERSTLLTDECKQCEFFRLCRGGCQRNRQYHETSGLYSNYFCEAYRMFFTQCEKQIYEIATKGIKG